MFNSMFSISKEYQKLITNIFFSGFFQMISLFTPIIITPYLIKVVGIEKYGLVSFMTVFFTYVYSITDYGFMVTGNREVAISKESKAKLAKILFDVLSAKFILIIISLFVLVICFFLIPKLSSNISLFCLGFTIVIGRVLIPNWFFQGLEQMKSLSLINGISQIIFVILIFMFIKKSEDFIWVIFFQGLTFIISGILGLVFIYVKIISKPKIVFSLTGGIHQLKIAFPIFLLSISSISYNNANLLILGLVSNDKVIGYFSIADKVITFVKQCIGALGIALLPHISRLATQSFTKVISFFKQFYIIIIIGVVFISSFIAIFAENITFWIVGNYNKEVTQILLYLTPIPIIIAISSIPYTILLSYDEKNNVSKVIILGCIINLLLNFVLASIWSVNGTITSIYFTELYVAVMLFYLLWRKFLKTTMIIENHQNH